MTDVKTPSTDDQAVEKVCAVMDEQMDREAKVIAQIISAHPRAAEALATFRARASKMFRDFLTNGTLPDVATIQKEDMEAHLMNFWTARAKKAESQRSRA